MAAAGTSPASGGITPIDGDQIHARKTGGGGGVTAGSGCADVEGSNRAWPAVQLAGFSWIQRRLRVRGRPVAVVRTRLSSRLRRRRWQGAASQVPTAALRTVGDGGVDARAGYSDVAGSRSPWSTVLLS
uniref:Uncharacterized protein n=1 Tax=Leersia perrieri TaxID=77586 RepID=A0A0D9VYE5_9ORYZ